MKFQYKEYGDVLRPVIPVVVSFNNNLIDCEVLIDSGSDRCFFDWEIGEAIGINPQNSQIQEVFGIGGKLSLYYTHPVTLTIGEYSYKIDTGFYSKNWRRYRAVVWNSGSERIF